MVLTIVIDLSQLINSVTKLYTTNTVAAKYLSFTYGLALLRLIYYSVRDLSLDTICVISNASLNCISFI